MPTQEQPVAQKSGRPTISVCMIVKNEEKFLAQCLKSVKDATDEIIIVDTGSTDKTVEIAQSFGAKVYHHPWRNSFSEARNHSLHYATCDWILQIDADEALEQSDVPRLHTLIQTNSHNVIYVAIYSDLPGGRAKHYFPRIFRRGKACFQGTVHNQLAFEGNALQSEITFYHYGYNLPQTEMQKKYKRTGDLLREQVAQEPDNIFALANLIRNYRNEYDFDKVIELGEKGLSMSVSQTDAISRGQRQKISIDLAHAFLNKNLTDRAEAICRQSLDENPHHFDMLLVLGETLFKKGEIHNALNYFKKYLIAKEKENKTPAFNLLAADFYSYEHCAYNHAGECYKRLGLINEAEVSYKKALELNNKEPLYYTNLAYLYLSQNRLDDAENILNLAIERDVVPYQIYLLLGKIYATQKRNEAAVGALKRSIQANPEKDASTYTCFINLLIQTNQLKEAEDTLSVIVPYYPGHLGLQCLREKIAYKNGDREGAVNFILNTLRSNTLDSDASLDIGDLCMEIEEYTLAIEALEKHLKTTSTPNAMVIANIAACYAKLGKLEPALYGFKAALQIDPSCNFALQNLAILEKKA